MENLVEIKYNQTGQSSSTNELGMREMQAMVYEQRQRQHLLVKAPPASGKSRAMMFVALDKLYNQGINKIIVSVPEKSIGRSLRILILCNSDSLPIGMLSHIITSVELLAQNHLNVNELRNFYRPRHLLKYSFALTARYAMQ